MLVRMLDRLILKIHVYRNLQLFLQQFPTPLVKYSRIDARGVVHRRWLFGNRLMFSLTYYLINIGALGRDVKEIQPSIEALSDQP
jgi:hypothetical protein